MNKGITVFFAGLLTLALVGCGQQLEAAQPELEIQRDGTELLIDLTPSSNFPRAKGKARYRDSSGQRDFRVEVENIRGLAGQQVAVCVNNTLVGTATVSNLGAARLNRETQLGQSVPFVSAGTAVKVATGTTCTGTTIVSGTF